MRFTLIIFISLFILGCKNPKTSSQNVENFKIGIVTDCQYCDCELSGIRYYKKSPNRLQKAVTELNTKDLEFTIHLGDFIDRDFESFDRINPIWDQLKSKSYHVLGNHDFSVANSLKKEVPKKLNLKNRYYSFETHQWKFIVLDGNDLSLHGSLDSIKIKEATAMYAQVQKDSLPYAKSYNGGLSSEQMDWVQQELDLAKENKLNVGFFDHFPSNPIDGHNLWNTKDFLALIANYPNVKLFMNGHNHSGSYIKENGIHYITFKGMVNTENTSSFAYAEITNDSVFIHGYGREENRRLKLKD